MSGQNPTLHVIHRIRAGTRHANPLPDPPDGRSLQRLWTLIDVEQLTLRGPVHNVSAFLEDRLHDWQVDSNGRLHYYSRVTPTDTWVDVVLDYETAAERREREALWVGRFDPYTGQPSGG